MFIQFIVEDLSGKNLIDAIMEKYKSEFALVSIDYKIRYYKGIGNFKKGDNAKK